MNNGLVIEAPLRSKVSLTTLLFFLLALLTGTFLRVSLLVIYPFMVFLVFIQLKLRLSRYAIGLFALIGISLLLSFWSGWYIKYKLLSLFYMLPFVLLLFGNPGPRSFSAQNLLHLFFRFLTVIAVINNVVGFIQVIRHPDSDDSFMGIYSGFSIALAGLVILNMILFAWYFYLYLATKKKKTLWVSLFFLVSFVMGFYGGGLVAFVIAFILTFFRPRLLAVIKFFFIAVLSLVAVYYILKLVKPNVLNYNINNLYKVVQYDVPGGARKVMAFRNYGVAYTSNIKDFLFGSGPGTFNSRSAFMVGSPSYFTAVSFLKSPHQPYYFQNYAYTLWNETNTSQALYQDGFRNQPFSSLLAFLGEYGFVFTFFFLWYYYRTYRKITRTPVSPHFKECEAYRKLTKFLFIFLLLLMCMDNFYEYPEVILLILTIIKLIQIEIGKLSMAGEQSEALLKTSS